MDIAISTQVRIMYIYSGFTEPIHLPGAEWHFAVGRAHS